MSCNSVTGANGAHYQLRCRECGKLWGNQPRSFCDDCFSPVEVAFDLDALRGSITRQTIAQRPTNIWRYSELLPVKNAGTLPVGFTQLVEASKLGRALGLRNVFVKNDAVCFPTLSFKDRVVAVAL